MTPTTDPHQPAHRGSGPIRSLAGRGLAMVALAAALLVGRADAQQSATIQASAVVMPSFVDVAVAPPAVDAGVAGEPQLRPSGSPAVANARLVRVRGVAGASIRTAAVAGRGPADGACAAWAASAGTDGATAPGAQRLCVVVEYPVT